MADGDKNQRGHKKGDGVADHRGNDLFVGDHRWQHRHPGGCVVIVVLDSQGPKMGRCPQENHQEQQPRGPTERICYRCPPHKDWDCARSSTDHDVLLAGALQPEGIDKDVEKGGGEGQNARKEVSSGPQDQKSHDFE